MQDHPEMPDWLNDLKGEIENTRMGQMRCKGCNQMVPINGAFMDVLIVRGISSIEKCKECRQRELPH